MKTRSFRITAEMTVVILLSAYIVFFTLIRGPGSAWTVLRDPAAILSVLAFGIGGTGLSGAIALWSFRGYPERFRLTPPSAGLIAQALLWGLLMGWTSTLFPIFAGGIVVAAACLLMPFCRPGKRMGAFEPPSFREAGKAAILAALPLPCLWGILLAVQRMSEFSD